MQWDFITNIILVIALIVLAIFVFLGLYQWITRGSIKKVDKQIRWMPLPLALMTIVYFIFDKLWIVNTRPNGSGEPSFPSTHVMVVATIFFIVTVILPKYVKSVGARIAIEITMFVLVSLTATGRVFAEMHYPIDVLGGLIFAFIFSEVYYYVIRTKKSKKSKKVKAKNE